MVTKLQLSQLAEVFNHRIDLFICCASYESRSLTIAKSLNTGNIGSSAVVVNSNLMEHVRASADELTALLPEVSTVLTTTVDPIITADAMSNMMSLRDDLWNSNGAKRIVIDMTTFTHEGLLILLQILRRYLSENVHINLVYAGATYSPEFDPNGGWLSRGVRQVRSVLGYPGRMMPTNKTHLIVLVGYEDDRAMSLIQSYEPEVLSLGYGTPGTQTSSGEGEKTNRRFLELVKQAYVTHPNVREFSFSCSDPINARDAMLNQVKLTPAHNHAIAPMNTKMSTLGSALVNAIDDSVQLCYAQAWMYNYADYSRPGESAYVLDLRSLFV